MKDKTKGWLVLVGTFLIMIVMIGIFGVFLATIQYSNNEELCERYSEYGYLTKMEGSFWNPECYIFMEDGTKVLIRDFNIADYKVPIAKEE